MTDENLAKLTITKETVENRLKTFESEVEKVQFLLDSLDKILFGSKVPHFKTFWEISTLFLRQVNEGTKELSPTEKKEWLDQFSYLSKEAKRLRDLRDQESSFHVEQFEGAILAIEKEWEEKKEMTADLDWPIHSIACQKKSDLFLTLQGRLLILQALFIRINALRKELADTDMRVRTKNALFERLSKLSGELFPERKKLMDELSSTFREVVQSLIEQETKKSQMTFFQLRDEIKSLQALAKWFVLTAPAFKETRLALSSLWDKLKEEEVQFKKARESEKEGLKANFEDLSKTVSQLKQEVESAAISKEVALKRLSDIQQSMRKRELLKNDVATLKQELFTIREKYDAEERKLEEERAIASEKRDQERKEKFSELQKEIQALLDQCSSLSVDEIVEIQKGMKDKISTFNKQDRLLIEKELRPLRDILVMKREEAFSLLPEAERNQLATQEKFLREKLQMRSEVAGEIENLKRAAEKAGMDLHRAMEIGERLRQEKERFSEIDASIQELEKMIKLSKTC